MTRPLIRNFPTSLTGSTNTVTATNSLLNLTGGFTMSLWAKFRSNGSGANLCTVVDAGVTNLVHVTQEANTGKLFTWVVQAGSGNLGCKSNNSVPLNKWVNIVVTYDGAGRTVLYLDGAVFASGGSSGKIPTATNRLEVYPISNGGHPITDVRFWPKVLTSTEISNLYYGNTNPVTPTLWWKLDEGSGSTAADSSGNGITGTITSAAWQSWSPMNFRGRNKEMMSGLSFDGSTSKVNLIKTVPVTSSITYSAWVNPSVNQGQRILGLNNNSSIRLSSAKKALFVLYGIIEYSSNSTVEKGKWTHVTATYDKVNVKIYINGVLDSVNAQTAAFPASGTLIEIGSYGGSPQFNGKIEDCKIWVDKALTASEISNLYYNNVYSKDKMLAEYFLNEGVGSTALDSSGNNNHATITSSLYTLDVPFRDRPLNRTLRSSLSFSGAGYVQLPAIPTTAGLSISAWIKTPTPVPATGMDIMGRSAGTSDLLELNTSGQLRFNFMTSLGPNSLLSATNILTKNKWHHVVGTYDLATATNKLYLDGVIVGSYTVVAGTISNNASTWMIGALTAATRNWVGNISDIRMFDGALTANQVLNIYQGKVDTSTMVPLIAKYSLDEGAGTPKDTANGLYNATSITSATYVLDTPFYKRSEVDPNLVRNGDFKYAPPFTAATTSTGRYIDGTSGGSLTNSLFGWTLITTAGAAEASFDFNEKRSGSCSMKLSNTSAAGSCLVGQGLGTGFPSKSDLMSLLPNTSYTLTGYIKTNNAASNSAFVDLRQYDNDGTAGVTTSTNKLTGTNDWTLVSLTVTTSSTTRLGRIFLRNVVTGNISDAWFADITVKPTTPVARLTP